MVVLLAALVAWGSDRRPTAGLSGRGLVGPRPVRPTPRTLRLGTYNIHGGRDAAGGDNLSRVAETLAGLDLVGLNEVRGPLPGRGPDQAEALGRQLGLRWLHAPSERRWWRDHWGNGLLSSWPVSEWQRVPLVGTRGKAFRNYLHATVDLGTTRLAVIVTHLDTADDRRAQLETVTRAFLALPPPAVLVGDLNTRRDDPLLAPLLSSSGVLDCLARSLGPADPPRIDWIISRGLTLREAGLRDYGASDHPALWAEFELPPLDLARRPAPAEVDHRRPVAR